jgi:hypothetical protein
MEQGDKVKGPWRRVRHAVVALGRRYPAPFVITVALLSNLTATVFNINYNGRFIEDRCTDAQQAAFWFLVSIYNPIAFPVGLGAIFTFAWPIQRHHRRVLRGEPLPPEAAKSAQRALVNLPAQLACVNCLCWIPGMFLFPIVILWLGGPEHAFDIWKQFLLSFGVGMLLTVAQTLFFVE